MKRNRIYSAIFAILAICLLFSCSSEQATIVTQTEQSKPQLTNDEFSFLERYIKKTKAVSPDEAATKVQIQDPETAKTRSADVNVTRIDVLRKMNYNLFGDSIFNLLPDTLVYLVSTDDGLCTAIPADYRATTSVLGNFPQSQIYDLATETDWEIRDMLCEMFASTTAAEICEYEASHDSLEKVVLEKLNMQNGLSSTRGLDDPGSGFDPNDYDFYEVYGPVITDDNSSYKSPMVPYAWNQFSPYNQYVIDKVENCNNPPVGCAALATAMIMTYWQYPNTVNGLTVNWSAIRSQNSYSPSEANLTGADQLAKLLGTGISMYYTCSVSTAQYDSITIWLGVNNYIFSPPANYSYNAVKTSLDHNRPVIICGFTSSSSIGHSWVIHGYVETHTHQERTIYAVHKVTGQQFVYSQETIYDDNYTIYNNMGNGSGTTSLNNSNLNNITFSPYSNNKRIYTGIRPQ